MRVRWDYMESIRIVRNGSMGYTAISHLMEKKLGWTASGGFARKRHRRRGGEGGVAHNKAISFSALHGGAASFELQRRVEKGRGESRALRRAPRTLLSSVCVMGCQCDVVVGVRRRTRGRGR